MEFTPATATVTVPETRREYGKTTVQGHSTLSPSEKAMVGALSGTMEAFIMQPTIAWKTALQARTRLSIHPRSLYRGVWANTAQIGPVTAVQFGLNHWMTSMVDKARRRYDWHDAHTPVKIAQGGISGIIGAMITSPAEVVMIQQQYHKKTLVDAASHIYATRGIAGFAVGYSVCAIRDGLYAASYLGLCPALKAYLHQHYFPSSPQTAGIVAGTVAGVFAGVSSQPFDVLKTKLQGVVPRGGRIVFAVYFLAEFGGWLSDKVEELKQRDTL